MPDWIDNTVTVTGTAAEIRALFDAGFEFDKLFPAPSDLDDNQATTWSYNHWGCRYADIEKIEYEPGSSTMKVNCRTANGGPIGFLAYLTRESPTLRITHICEQWYGAVLCHMTYAGGVVDGGEFCPEMFTSAALRAFSATNPWFHAENLITMMQEMGYPDKDHEKESVVELTPIHITYDEYVTRSLQNA